MEIQTENQTDATMPAKNKSIVSRVQLCPQATGRDGKSTWAEIQITALRRHKIPFAAIDCDNLNRMLSSRYPDEVDFLDAAHSPKNFNQLADAIGTNFPVTVLDFPGNATESILANFDRLSLLDTFEQSGIRLTVSLFVTDDRLAMQSASMVKEFFRERVDYLLIRNPATAKNDGEKFMSSNMAKWFEQRKSPTITIPEAQESTFVAWHTLERRLKQHLPLDQACEHKDLTRTVKKELQHLRDNALAQIEEHARFFLPDPSLFKNSTAKAPLKAWRPIHPFEDTNY